MKKLAAVVILIIAALLALPILWRLVPHGGPPRIALVGDSTVAGYTDPPGWTEPFAFGFRPRLVSLLEAAGCEFVFVGDSAEPWDGRFGTPRLAGGEADLRAINRDQHRGYGGLRPRDALMKLPAWLLVDDPDIVAIQVGINSIAVGSDEASFGLLRTMDALFVGSKILLPDADVLMAQIPPYATPTAAVDDFDRYISDHYPTVDLRSPFMGQDGLPRTDMYANGLNHPTNAAYAMIAKQWFDVLEPILRRRGACA